MNWANKVYSYPNLITCSQEADKKANLLPFITSCEHLLFLKKDKLVNLFRGKKHTLLQYGIKFMTKSPNMSSIGLIRGKPTFGGPDTPCGPESGPAGPKSKDVGQSWARIIIASLNPSPLDFYAVGRSWVVAIKFSSGPPILISIRDEMWARETLACIFLEEKNGN